MLKYVGTLKREGLPNLSPWTPLRCVPSPVSCWYVLDEDFEEGQEKVGPRK